MITRHILVIALTMLFWVDRAPAPIVEETSTPAPTAPPQPHRASPTPTLIPEPVTASPSPRSTVANIPKPAPSIKPKAGKSKAREGTKNVSQEQKKPALELPKVPVPANQSTFDGTWKGSINLVPARNWHGTGRLIGTFNVELTVEGDGTAITEHCRNSTVTLRCHRDGKMLRWDSAVFKDVSCSLTPMSDGRTALVMFRNDFYGEPTAIFEKAAP